MKIKEVEIQKGKVKRIAMNRNLPIVGNEQTPFDRYGFSCLVSSPPGGGKTNFIVSQLTSRNGYFYRKFFKIYFFSPSLHTIQAQIALPEDQFYDELDFDVVQNIMDENKERVKNGDNTEVLIIFDDLLAEISKSGNITTFQKLINNRAHCKCSIIVSIQTYNRLPLSLRKSFSHLVQFKASNKELETIREEITPYSKDEWKDLLRYVYKDPHDYLVLINDGRVYKNNNLLQIDSSEEE